MPMTTSATMEVRVPCTRRAPWGMTATTAVSAIRRHHHHRLQTGHRRRRRLPRRRCRRRRCRRRRRRRRVHRPCRSGRRRRSTSIFGGSTSTVGGFRSSGSRLALRFASHSYIYSQHAMPQSTQRTPSFVCGWTPPWRACTKSTQCSLSAQTGTRSDSGEGGAGLSSSSPLTRRRRYQARS